MTLKCKRLTIRNRQIKHITYIIAICPLYGLGIRNRRKTTMKPISRRTENNENDQK